MRKLVYGALAVMMGVGSLQARMHTNKTFMMPRSHNENLAMEYSTWHKQFRHIDENKWGGTVQATGFYQQSTNKTDIGKYFGKYNNATGPNVTNPYAGTIQDFIWVKSPRSSTPSPLNNEGGLLLASENVIHGADSEYTTRLDVRGTFRPKQTSYGVRLDYHQNLDKLSKGLYFKVTAPIVHVKNDMGVTYSGSKLKQKLPNGATTGKEVTLADYLAGNVENTYPNAIQKKLTHAKIPCDSDNSSTGFADVDVTFGYNFLYKEEKHFGVNVCLTIPTNDVTSGEWLFDPVLGLGGHWALGCGVDGAFELWKQDNKSLEFLMAVNYKYVFNETEKRTLGFKHPDDLTPDTLAIAGKRVGFGHYFLGGKKGEKGVFPLANVLTRDVGVEPGSMVEALTSLAFNWKNFTFDLGYNLFAKEGETVTVKDWPENTFAIAKKIYDTTNFFEGTSSDPTKAQYAFDGTSADDTGSGRCIQKEHLLPGDAATPVYVTHKVFAGAGYLFKDWQYPMMFGLGGSFEWEQGSNSALDGFAFWGKVGVEF